LDYVKIFREKNITLYGSDQLPQSLQVYETLPNVISFALPLPRAIVREIAENGPTKTYFHHYRTCNAYIDHVSYTLVLAIKAEGYDAVYIPASQSVSEDGYRGLFPHKAAAVLCGLGGIGMNDLLITPDYGASVRLGTVMTDLPVARTGKTENPCTGCAKCVSACPSGALFGKKWETGISVEEIIDVRLCSAHMKKAYKKIGRGAVCGICMAVCPVGRVPK
jgi:epoxyqueuosine reductase